jgi:hypothetical protein
MVEKTENTSAFSTMPPKNHRNRAPGATIEGVHAAFGTVLWIVCIGGAIVAVVGLVSTRKTWDDFGKDGLLMDSELARRSHTSAASLLERDEEIRQMLEARNARRIRRGEQPVDVEEELARLTAPVIDPELRSEIRDLVIARNYRRARTGKPPLDVEAEIEREIAELANL